MSREIADVNLFSFGSGLNIIKRGGKIARKGWNGKGMYIYLIEETSRYKQCIGLHTADGEEQPGWVASQQDYFADDWYIVDLIYQFS